MKSKYSRLLAWALILVVMAGCAAAQPLDAAQSDQLVEIPDLDTMKNEEIISWISSTYQEYGNNIQDCLFAADPAVSRQEALADIDKVIYVNTYLLSYYADALSHVNDLAAANILEGNMNDVKATLAEYWGDAQEGKTGSFGDTLLAQGYSKAEIQEIYEPLVDLTSSIFDASADYLRLIDCAAMIPAVEDFIEKYANTTAYSYTYSVNTCIDIPFKAVVDAENGNRAEVLRWTLQQEREVGTWPVSVEANGVCFDFLMPISARVECGCDRIYRYENGCACILGTFNGSEAIAHSVLSPYSNEEGSEDTPHKTLSDYLGQNNVPEDSMTDTFAIQEAYEQVFYGMAEPISYAVFDIDADGADELIVKGGTCEADYVFMFYAYENGNFLPLGTTGAGHSVLVSDGEVGIIVSGGQMGYEWADRITISNGALHEEPLYERDIGNEPYTEWDIQIEMFAITF